MSVQSAPFYWLTCDWPGCDVRSTEDGEYSAFDNVDSAVSDAEDCHWLVTDDGLHLCSAHTVWNDDLDERVPVPDAMFLVVRNAEYELHRIRRRIEVDVHFRVSEASRRLEREGTADRETIAASERRKRIAAAFEPHPQRFIFAMAA